MKLTDKQEQFCLEYLIDLNATQAAIRSGYSEKTAKDIGCQNLAKLNIQEKISELKKKRNEKVGITHEEILRELKNFAYSDITDTLTLDAESLKGLPSNIRRLITQYKRVVRTDDNKTEEYVELKFIDKMKAFEMLNKHTGFYEEDNSKEDDVVKVEIVYPNKNEDTD